MVQKMPQTLNFQAGPLNTQQLPVTKSESVSKSTHQKLLHFLSCADSSPWWLPSKLDPRSVVKEAGTWLLSQEFTSVPFQLLLLC